MSASPNPDCRASRAVCVGNGIIVRSGPYGPVQSDLIGLSYAPLPVVVSAP